MKQKLKVNIKKQYKSRRGSIFSDKEAETIGIELERIKESNGNLTTKGVLKESEKIDSKLHKYFDWDNKKASQMWREQQARNIIANIVEIVIIDNKPIKQRSFLSVSKGQAGASNIYITIEEAVDNVDYKKQLLSRIITMQENLLNTMKVLRENY